MSKDLSSILTVLLLVAVMLLSSGTALFADSNKIYTISAYDVNVRILQDGSLDITDSIKYTSFGGYNNTMILIDKREDEEIEVKNVYMQRKDGYIECDRLNAGQWDANVFNGTYSVIQEKDLVRVKVYGTFSNRYGNIVVNYRVKNGIKRYGDVAEYKRTHIQKSWEGRVSNINIYVILPEQVETDEIRTFLHGVIVGRKKVESQRTITYNVPDTVPGEYVEARIVFPANIVPNAPVTYNEDYLEEILTEEKEYDQSDKTELLKARENAAREAGRQAWIERMKQRARRIATVFSIIASALGIYTLLKIRRKLHQLKKLPVSMNLHGVEKLSPPEVRLLMANGKTGARSFLGSLLYLSSLGFFRIRVRTDNKRSTLEFSGFTDRNDIDLLGSEIFLLDWVSKMSDDSGVFGADKLHARSVDTEKAKEMKKQYMEWESRIIKDYSEKNTLEPEVVKYRILGLITGACLFFLGCVVPVTLSIWAGYSMLPVGLVLFLYTLRIRKHTDFGIDQHRVWKDIRKRILSRTIALDSLPVWMKNSLSLLGYIIAMGAEKELQLVRAALANEGDCSAELYAYGKELESLVRETIRYYDSALSSSLDVIL